MILIPFRSIPFITSCKDFSGISANEDREKLLTITKKVYTQRLGVVRAATGNLEVEKQEKVP